ncbi:SPOR domain-containing protein [Tautonia sociabilis]|uniref:SPOR domain-containing protein n=1 Tax=Tautonia sociabilis TaxID=2080755 RepID=A0A432MPD2_9BACT|nr:SPOR domain-containing protein [Tautonia sociabilis]RUL89262.1 hypothetical protein TsocGM_02255 [Tautonia sociabilis]
MWTCRNCSAQSEVAEEVCPSCGSVEVELTAADELATTVAGTVFEDGSTEFDLSSLPDPAPAIVECFIAVSEAEASAVANRLRDLGISVQVTHDADDRGDPVHRVRVPFVDLGRALAVVDLLHRRR